MTSTKGFPEIKAIWFDDENEPAVCPSAGVPVETFCDAEDDSSELARDVDCDLLARWDLSESNGEGPSVTLA